MRWPRSPAKNSAFGRLCAERGEESQVSDAEILRLVDDREIEWRILALGDRVRQRREQAGVRDQLLRIQPGDDPLEDRPQNLALRLRQAGLPAEPGDVAIGFPGFQLPGVDQLLPFRQQKLQAEFVAGARPCGFA